jgi:hypothetical protein
MSWKCFNEQQSLTPWQIYNYDVSRKDLRKMDSNLLERKTVFIQFVIQGTIIIKIRLMLGLKISSHFGRLGDSR